VTVVAIMQDVKYLDLDLRANNLHANIKCIESLPLSQHATCIHPYIYICIYIYMYICIYTVATMYQGLKWC